MEGDQRVVRGVLLDSFWEGRRDETRDNDVAEHFCDQSCSWHALSSRLVCVKKAPGRVESGDGRLEHEQLTPRKTCSLYMKYGDHLGKVGRVVVREK